MIPGGNYIVHMNGSDPVYVSVASGRLTSLVEASEMASLRADRDGRAAIEDAAERAVPVSVEVAVGRLVDPLASPECVQVYRLGR